MSMQIVQTLLHIDAFLTGKRDGVDRSRDQAHQQPEELIHDRLKRQIKTVLIVRSRAKPVIECGHKRIIHREDGMLRRERGFGQQITDFLPRKSNP
ncbi:hypothetical protein D3C73_1137750 [compost metagenome]